MRSNGAREISLNKAEHDSGMTMSTIFIHSPFRSASTWLFDRFRVSEINYCFYEALHEKLSVITQQDVQDERHDAWDSGHPPMDPYFQEFASLLNLEGGVKLYRNDFAFDYFVPTQGLMGELTVHEADYLNSLIGHARELGKRPVLTFNRSLGRIAALKKEFGGYHIANVRNLFDQWVSALSYAEKGNDYFLRVLFEIIMRNRSRDRFLDLLGTSTIHCERADFVGFASCRACCTAFFCFHLYFYMFCRKTCDLVVEIDRLVSDPEYRRATENEIRRGTGADVDLSSAASRVSMSRSALDQDCLDLTAIDQFLETGARCLEDQIGLNCEDVLKEARLRLHEAVEAQHRYEKYYRPVQKLIVKAERAVKRAEQAETRAEQAETRAEQAETRIKHLVAMLTKAHLRPWRPINHYIQYVAATTLAPMLRRVSPQRAGRLLRVASKRNPRRFNKLIQG